MSDLAAQVIKTYPENRGMQLVCLRGPARFFCHRCQRPARAALLAVVSGDWNRLLCNACYKELLAEPGKGVGKGGR